MKFRFHTASGNAYAAKNGSKWAFDGPALRPFTQGVGKLFADHLHVKLPSFYDKLYISWRSAD